MNLFLRLGICLLYMTTCMHKPLLAVGPAAVKPVSMMNRLLIVLSEDVLHLLPNVAEVQLRHGIIHHSVNQSIIRIF